MHEGTHTGDSPHFVRHTELLFELERSLEDESGGRFEHSLLRTYVRELSLTVRVMKTQNEDQRVDRSVIYAKLM